MQVKAAELIELVQSHAGLKRVWMLQNGCQGPRMPDVILMPTTTFCGKGRPTTYLNGKETWMGTGRMQDIIMANVPTLKYCK